jgi:hypothetical protein
MLYTVKLNTSFLSRLSNFPDFFLFLSELQINTLVLICQLLSQSVLQPCHQGMVGWQECLSTVVKVLIHSFIFSSVTW